MRNSIVIICALAALWGPGICLSAAPNDSWPPAVQSNTERLVQEGLPASDLASITQAMVQARFTERETIRLQNTILQTYRQGLPITPVNQKILEGIAKDAPAGAIILAAERVMTRYQHSLRLAAQLTEERKLANQWGTLIATGNAAGLPFDDMETIIEGVQSRSRTENNSGLLITETLTTARDMARQSVPPESVTQIITLALKQGFNGQEMRQLNSTFASRSRQNSLETVTRNCLADLQKSSSPTQALHTFGSQNRYGGSAEKGLGKGIDASQGRSTDNSGSSSGNGGSNSGSGNGGNGGGGGGAGGNGSNGNGGGNGGGGGGGGGGQGR